MSEAAPVVSGEVSHPAARQATRFRLDAIAPMPWKNGGGTTRELAVWPPGAAMDDFAWRISVADITADGPFSAFPGIDRQIALIEGAGVRLEALDGSFGHRLDRIGVPYAFAGETAVHGALIAGPTRDFNVMTRRDRCHAKIEGLHARFSLSTGEHATLLLVVRGSWRDDGSRADSGQSDGGQTHSGQTHSGQTFGAGDGILFPAGAAVAVPIFTPAEPAALCLRVELHMEPVR